MGAELIPLVIFGLQEAIKYAPALAEEIRVLLSKGDPTPEDWLALQQKYATKTYEQYVPESGLIPSQPTQ